MGTEDCKQSATVAHAESHYLLILGMKEQAILIMATYLGMEMQSSLKFDKHIVSKIKSAWKILGRVKYSPHEAPERGKLLAYTSLCWPILEEGDTL